MVRRSPTIVSEYTAAGCVLDAAADNAPILKTNDNLGGMNMKSALHRWFLSAFVVFFAVLLGKINFLLGK